MFVFVYDKLHSIVRHIKGGLSMNKTVGILLVLLVLGGITYMLMQPKPPTDVSSENVVVTEETPIVPTDASMVAKEGVITVEGSPFQFAPNTITVKKGVSTTLLFKNIEGMHDFVVDELNIKTKVLKSGEEESVTFTADAVGSYEFYCSVTNHRAMGMKGTLVVVE